jgi:hypothetical protein
MTIHEFPHLRFKYEDAGRPPILEAADMTLAAYIKGRDSIGHNLPPRMGKSTLIHILAVEFQAQGAPFVHAMTPWTSLASQLTSSDKITANLERVVAEGWDDTFVCQAMDVLPSTRYWQRQKKGADRYTLLATTIHLANYHSFVVENAVSLAYESSGKRPVIIVDEVHLMALGQKWADALLRFQQAGAYVVTMTGTAKRADDACILGFKQEPLSDWEEKSQVVTVERGIPYYKDADGLLVRVRNDKNELRKVNERRIVTVATGLTVGWDVAFSSGWMHGVNPQPQDFTVVLDGEPVAISGVSLDVAKKNLGRWVRSSECCRHLAAKGVEWLSVRRSRELERNTKMLVVTAADELGSRDDKEANVHAREMRRQIESAISEDPLLSEQDLLIEVCTSTTETGEPDEKAAEKLYRFGLTRTDDKGREPIDILIVKGMGLVGLDVPECKVLIDCSTFRAGPVKSQLATRPLTVWTLADGSLAPDAQIAYPCDPANHAFYESLALASGEGKERVVLEAQQEEVINEVKDPPAPLEIEDGSGRQIGYLDESAKWVEGDYDRLLARIHATWPETVNIRRITLIEMYRNGAFPDDAMVPEEPKPAKPKKPRVQDLGAELDDAEAFGAKANKIANEISPYAADPARYRETVRLLQSKAKQRCRLSPDLSVSNVQDPALKAELVKALNAAKQEVLQEMGR